MPEFSSSSQVDQKQTDLHIELDHLRSVSLFFEIFKLSQSQFFKLVSSEINGSYLYDVCDVIYNIYPNRTIFT
jgi:hypothetical protein